MKVNNQTIIITDPCYLITDNNDHDWEKCDFGDNMGALGIDNYICRSTGYGDWSCTTYNTDTDKSIGTFTADAGLVGVFLLDEVLKYNPHFLEETPKFCYTEITNFNGEVDFEVDYDDTNDFCMEIVSVVGNGNINFHTKQTGF